MLDGASSYKKYFTMSLNISGKPCLICGGGDVARRKAESLKEAGAKLTVISPKLDPVFEYMSFQHEIVWREKEFDPGDLNGAFLAVAATDQKEVNVLIARLCKERGILCNCVDQPEEGSYIVPTSLNRGPLTIAIATSGISPALASSIKQELEGVYGEEYGLFLELMAPLRVAIQDEFKEFIDRAKIYRRMVASNALQLLKDGDTELAEKELKEILYQAISEKNPKDS